LIGRGLNGLGNVAIAEGDLDRAAPLFEELLTLSRKTNNRQAIAIAVNNLGIVAAQQGNLARAEALLEESLALDRERGDKNGIAYSLINIGGLLVARGDTVRAVRFLQDGLTAGLEIGLKDFLVAEGLAGLGAAVGATGRPEQAARLFGAADALVEAIGTMLDPILPAAHERAVTSARDALGKEAFVTAHAAGAALSLEEAIAEALALAVAAECAGEAAS
jgi:tetratricopeptide (TPR) repeat protein